MELIYHQEGLPSCFISWYSAMVIVREMLLSYDCDTSHICNFRIDSLLNYQTGPIVRNFL